MKKNLTVLICFSVALLFGVLAKAQDAPNSLVSACDEATIPEMNVVWSLGDVFGDAVLLATPAREASQPVNGIRLLQNLSPGQLIVVQERERSLAYRIFSAGGQFKWAGGIAGTQTAIGTSMLAPGVYFISFSDENGYLLETLKFVKL